MDSNKKILIAILLIIIIGIVVGVVFLIQRYNEKENKEGVETILKEDVPKDGEGKEDSPTKDGEGKDDSPTKDGDKSEDVPKNNDKSEDGKKDGGIEGESEDVPKDGNEKDTIKTPNDSENVPKTPNEVEDQTNTGNKEKDPTEPPVDDPTKPPVEDPTNLLKDTQDKDKKDKNSTVQSNDNTSHSITNLNPYQFFDFRKTNNDETILIFPLGNFNNDEFDKLKDLENEENLQSKWTSTILKSTQRLGKDYVKGIIGNSPPVHDTIMIPATNNLFINLFYSTENLLKSQICPFELFQIVFKSFKVFINYKDATSDYALTMEGYRNSYLSLYRNLITRNETKEDLNETILNTPIYKDHDNLRIYKSFLDLFFENYSCEELIRDKIDHQDEYNKIREYFEKANLLITKTIAKQEKPTEVDFTTVDYIIFVNRKASYSK